MEKLLTEIDDGLPRNKDELAFAKLLDSNPEWNLESTSLNDSPNDGFTNQWTISEPNHSVSNREDDQYPAEEARLINNNPIGSYLLYASSFPSSQSFKTGVSRQSDRIQGENKINWTKGKDVRDSWEAVHKDGGYQTRCPTKSHNGGPMITLFYMQIFFPMKRKFHAEYFTVLPEFCEEGTRNPNAWATASEENDPASRMAIKIRSAGSDGRMQEEYLHRDTMNAVTTANAFADRVLLGLDASVIATKPRRWTPKKFGIGRWWPAGAA